MKQKDAELEDSLVHFCKYLQENDAKRAKALKKAADERRLHDEKVVEAKELVNYIAQLLAVSIAGCKCMSIFTTLCCSGSACWESSIRAK